MEIHDVVFRGAALESRQRPQEWLPQIAVAGRSNVGKSSLLNWLFRRTLARVAKEPGKTRTLNFYQVDRKLFIVDLPGYGYARIDQKLRTHWARELTGYLHDEPRLAGVICLLDVRHGLTERDMELLQLIIHAHRDWTVVLTEADKVGRSHRAAMQHEVQRELGLERLPLAVSVRTGEGRHDLLQQIDEIASRWRDAHRGD